MVTRNSMQKVADPETVKSNWSTNFGNVLLCLRRLNLIELQRTLARCDLGPLTSESEGHAYYRLYKLYASCWDVYRSRDKTSNNSEWPSLHEDLKDLASLSIPVAQKMKITERMQSTYKLFKVPRT